MGTLASLVLIFIAVGGLRSGAALVLQRNCETTQRWMDMGPLRWAALNGLALGSGWYSRIGFPLWYVLPVAALCLGSATWGAAIIGLYGLSRGAAAPLLMVRNRKRDDDAEMEKLLNANQSARKVGFAMLLMVSGISFVLVGF